LSEPTGGDWQGVGVIGSIYGVGDQYRVAMAAWGFYGSHGIVPSAYLSAACLPGITRTGVDL